jgi:hypothetical protein
MTPRTVGGSGGAEYKLTDAVTLTGQLSLERSIIDDGVSEGTFTLLGVPLGLVYDTTDDLLDPSRGTRLNFGTTPYLSVADSDVNFAVFRLSDAFYVSLEKEHDVVLATWGRVGTIVGGDSTAELPATKRLYGGGAGRSVPTGTRSLTIGADGDRPAGARSSDWAPSCAGGCSRVSARYSSRAATSMRRPLAISISAFYGAPASALALLHRLRAGAAGRAFPINPRRSDDVFQFYVE